VNFSRDKIIALAIFIGLIVLAISSEIKKENEEISLLKNKKVTLAWVLNKNSSRNKASRGDLYTYKFIVDGTWKRGSDHIKKKASRKIKKARYYYAIYDKTNPENSKLVIGNPIPKEKAILIRDSLLR